MTPLQRLCHAVWYAGEYHTKPARIQKAMREQVRYGEYKRNRREVEREKRGR